MAELIVLPRDRRFRREVPREHRTSLDTRVRWLWNQRAGTIQSIWKHSPDVLDQTAATMLLQIFMGQDLNAIALVFRRLEGGELEDSVIAENELRF